MAMLLTTDAPPAPAMAFICPGVSTLSSVRMIAALS